MLRILVLSSGNAATEGWVQLCPSERGAVVFQARALYNAIYNVNANYPDCEEEREDRAAVPNEVVKSGISEWNVDLFPNPASLQVTFASKTENEVLEIVITDISGRRVMKETVKTNGFIANLGVQLANGAYFVVIKNGTGETKTKKLLIAK